MDELDDSTASLADFFQDADFKTMSSLVYGPLGARVDDPIGSDSLFCDPTEPVESTPSSDATTSSSQRAHALSAIKIKGKIRPSSVQRYKHEMEQLRGEIQELEATLSQLRRSKGSTESVEKLFGSSMWKDIAKRQRDIRKCAEIDNVKLRLQLQAQIKVAHSLKRLIRKQSLEKSPDRVPRSPSLCLPLQDDVEAVFQSIHDDLRRRPVLVDEMMHAFGLGQVRGNSNNSQIRRGDNLCVDYQECCEFPFSFDAIADAMWKFVSVKQLPMRNGVYSSVTQSDTLCHTHFGVTRAAGRSSIKVDSYLVGTREIQRDRIIHCLEIRTYTTSSLLRGKRVCIRGQGYSVVEKSSYGTTLVKSCIRCCPERNNATIRNPEKHFEQLANALVTSCHDSIESMTQGIENVLLDEGRKQ
ncbi:hypothetical protein Poli38472_004831 [Pythium oligandrum]|uniref:M96 mating-specific protein family n=1 Tax=Pythium oligandrum TaxID=41045 RepID=A0A8K1FHH7_PYTOL|nr:hypothetical protein Poli38472_004831 [Pythium oligandrum]|eukprot:TMW59762.1 hypothetical protein Poli38472_004831 [Pythium oligandrum]